MRKFIICIGCMLFIAGCDSAKNEKIISNLEQQLAASKHKVQETQDRLDKADKQFAAATEQLTDANAKLAASERILKSNIMITNVDGENKEDIVALYGGQGGESFVLKINEVIFNGFSSYLDGDFQEVDLDLKDQIKEISISESDPSMHYETSYYYLNRSKNQIEFMGKFQGKGTDMEYPGDGTLILHRKRGAIIQNWYHDQTYKLNAEHLFDEVPQDLYNMNAKVKMTKALQLYKDRNNKEKAFIIQPGSDAEIISSDDKRWCLIQAANGQKGWFEVEGYNNIVGTDGTADDYMSGLGHAG
ncbi:hypothetical protein EHS13_03810 [Paenibacillus psychroresistens]|uniref:SH3 domain-containing protein n=1 Tax=Paenibacillus psychroresistens TaxID=1778678 RepID=A0A6B8RF00_9BACL|nr:hypothetical protein [Paenibacillus psychroresistens]QGQ94093.1 hypothetical protein EHS13_03810 [Paenibacillus psychroresistens]